MATVLVPINRAYICFDIAYREKTAADGQRKCDETYHRLVQNMSKLGVKEDALQTCSLRVNTNMDNQRHVADYQVVHLLRVTFDNVGLAGQLLDTIREVGNTTVREITFDTGDLRDLQHQALSDATAHAREKALIIATKLNTVIVGTKSVDETFWQGRFASDIDRSSENNGKAVEGDADAISELGQIPLRSINALVRIVYTTEARPEFP